MDLQILINIGNQTIPIYINRQTSIYQIKNILLKKLNRHNYPSNINSNNLYLTYGGKLLENSEPISIYDIPPNSIIFAQFKLCGGIISVKSIVNGILSFLKPIAKPLYDIILAVVSFVLLIVELLMMLPKVLEAAINIFNPTKLIDDILFGTAQGINEVMKNLMNSMDFSSANPRESPGDGPFGTTKGGKLVCVPPTMLNIIFLILCPPLALFLHSGIKGFFQVIVCSLLTLKAYYFPGLIYAALHILC